MCLYYFKKECKTEGKCRLMVQRDLGGFGLVGGGAQWDGAWQGFTA